MARELVESRRTQYTRRALRDALIELLADKPLARITVRELCERADVNRSTFYAHYPDLDSLLRDIEEDTIDWVNGTLQQLLERPDPRQRRPRHRNTSAGTSPTIAAICVC